MERRRGHRHHRMAYYERYNRHRHHHGNRLNGRF
jgi:hypothetical protein